MAAVAREQSSEGLPRGVGILGPRLQERRRDEHLAASDDAARFQDPFHFGQRGRGIGNVHKNRMAMSGVEGVVFKGQVGHVPYVKRRVVMSARRGGGSGHLDLRLFHVDAVHLARFHRPGQTDRDSPRAATEVEYTEVGLKVR